MNEQIKHEGRIENIEGEHITVRIVQSSACLHCKIAGHCGSADSKEKIVDVWSRTPGNYAVGQTVNVVMGGKLGLKAVLYAFVIPVAIAMAIVFLSLQLTSAGGRFELTEPYNQGVAALTGMATFAIYYIFLYFCRDTLKQEFKFRIE